MEVRQNKTFANYRAKAVQLLKSYEQYEKNYVSPEAKQKLVNLQLQALKNGVSEELIKENPEKYTELIMCSNEFNEQVSLAREMFMIEGECANARAVCEIYYVDCDFDKQLELDYDEFYKFIMETFNGFFLKHKTITVTGMLGQNHSTSEMQATQT